MPKKREGEAQKRVHIWVFESDWEELTLMYGSTIGPSKFVRLAIRQVLKKVRERQNAKPTASHTIDLGDNILDDSSA